MTSSNSSFSCTVSVPCVVHPFGEYSSIFHYPGLACAIDKRLQLEVKPSEFEFSVVDGYKLEPFKQKIFYDALEKLWPDLSANPLEFITGSDLPLLTTLGTPSVLALAISTAIYELRKQKKAEQDNNPELNKKHYNSEFLAQKGYNLDAHVDELCSPLSTSVSTCGGCIFSNNDESDALWPLGEFSRSKRSSKKGKDLPGKGKKQSYAHSLELSSDLTLVLGFLKTDIFNKFKGPKLTPLFDKPMLKKPTKSDERPNVIPFDFTTNYDSIPWKLHRFMEKSGFARDNMKDLGKLVEMSIDSLKTGNLMYVGTLMNKQQNLLTILGVQPKELKPLFEAAAEDSYGVALMGTNENAIISLPKDPVTVAEKIVDTGGEAIIVKSSSKGIKYY